MAKENNYPELEKMLDKSWKFWDFSQPEYLLGSEVRILKLIGKLVPGTWMPWIVQQIGGPQARETFERLINILTR